jgi:enoyl-CoA hydratase/3-hydroxyacyl-CoA dehydrogenase
LKCESIYGQYERRKSTIRNPGPNRLLLEGVPMIVGVIGSGSIGPDLAYGFVSALAGSGTGHVFLHDIRKDALDAGVARIKGYVEKGVSRGRLSPRLAERISGALRPTLDLKDLASCDYVLEAATEDLATKRVILRQLEGTVREDCLIGFATSGLPRARIAAEARYPDRCFVNHPFFPAWRALPIEVVLSGDRTLGLRMLEVLMTLGKVPVVTADVPCFAADDIFCNYISEAARIVEEGIASPAQVDRIVNDHIGGGGPFNVMDLTRGNMLTVHCQDLMKEAASGGNWFAAPAILMRQGSAAWHDQSKPTDAGYTPSLASAVMDRILAVLLARTYFVVDQGICDASDLNWLTRNALGFSDGLLDLAEKVGAERAHRLCTAYAAAHPGFPIPQSLAGKSLRAFARDIKVHQEGDIRVVTIRRPEVKNALSARTMQEIRAAVEAASSDPAVKGIVLTGFGGALAGADINELAALTSPADCEAMCLRGYDVLDVIAKSAKPVVAALDGPVLGGGAELSMACHARVVGPNLVVGQPEVNLGIIPGYGGTQRLPRLVGVAASLELLRTGRTMTAEEAWKCGWASAPPSANVGEAACELVRAHIEGKAALAPVDPTPLAVPDALPRVDIGHRSLAIDAILVDTVRRGLAVPLDEGLRVEAKGFARCRTTVDMDIGMKNFIQNGPRVPAVFMHE